MEALDRFILEHSNDDVAKLILNKEKWEGIDMELAVNTIESRRKLRGKVQEWAEMPGLRFPYKLSAEQCSSSFTAQYKAKLAEKIFADNLSGNGCEKTGANPHGRRCRIADLTGGLGVDSLYFSKFAVVLYNEMKPLLAEASRHNFNILGADSIIVKNHELVAGSEILDKEFFARHTSKEAGSRISAAELFSDFRPDIIYLDPARRGEGGRKVFLIEECSPDVLGLKDELFAQSRHIMLKLSPMADISMVCKRLGSQCREVHVVATGGECKELLVWLDREWDGEYRIVVCENGASLDFLPSEEKEAVATTADRLPAKGSYIFEAGKAVMKAGAFNYIAAKFKMSKLGRSTHYYFTDDKDLSKYGKLYEIIETEHLDKRSLKKFADSYPSADLTARNLPFDTETLRIKMYGKNKTSAATTDSIHIFALKSDCLGNILIAARR